MLDSGGPQFYGRFHVPRYDVQGLLKLTSLAVANCQPWFYLRLAASSPRPMALLGYPREHTVPRETWRQRRTQPNPAKILTLEPERSEPRNSRGGDSGLPCGLGALKRLVTSVV